MGKEKICNAKYTHNKNLLQSKICSMVIYKKWTIDKYIEYKD